MVVIHKKEQSIGIHNIVNESQKNHAKWQKLEHQSQKVMEYISSA